MRAVAAVTILLLALSETVHAFGGGVPFALDADGCVVDYQAGCAALYIGTMVAPHRAEFEIFNTCLDVDQDHVFFWHHH